MVIASMYFIIYTINYPNHLDFNVFYGAATRLLGGKTPYVYYGNKFLPFWYFPWTAWLFIPFTAMSQNTSWIVFSIFNILTIAGIIFFFSAYYQSTLTLTDKFLLFSSSITLSWLLFKVGQMTMLNLLLIIIIMFLMKKKHFVIAGLLSPFLLIKPHLLLLFLPAILLIGKKKFVLAGSLSSILFLTIAQLATPSWLFKMYNLLTAGSQRVSEYFTTFSTFLGGKQNWIGTAYLPITIILYAITALALWKVRSLPTVPFLSLALGASLFVAPRAYSYDLPLLLPLVMWLTKDIEKKWHFYILILLTFYPFIFNFGSSLYLVTILIVVFGMLKAKKNIQISSTGNIANNLS